MHKKSKTLILILTAIIVILTVLAGLTFAADNSSKLAATFTKLSAYIHAGQYISFIKDTSCAAFVMSLFLFRALFLKRSQD